MAMNTDRFEELLGRLLDDELSLAEGSELAAALRAEPARLRELRQHLGLWELWAQQQAPERSAEAFLAACRTRLRAEREGENFLTRLKERIARDSTKSKVPTRMAWAASIALLISATAILLWQFSAHPTTETMIALQGEAVCPACVLHEGHEHVPAVRVRKSGATRVYYLDPSPALARQQGYFCGGPTPVAIEGKTHRVGNRDRLTVSHIELPSTTKQ
jgi:anti-sigma factor RsiW